MSKTKDEDRNTVPTELNHVRQLSSTPSPENRGCATSFLTRKKNESDKVCGALQPDSDEEYVQRDEEKESGGEA
jgi:hypothetical protein